MHAMLTHAHHSCTSLMQLMHLTHAHHSCSSCTSLMHLTHAAKHITHAAHAHHSCSLCTPLMHLTHAAHAHHSCSSCTSLMHITHAAHAHHSCSSLMHITHAPLALRHATFNFLLCLALPPQNWVRHARQGFTWFSDAGALHALLCGHALIAWVVVQHGSAFRSRGGPAV